MGMNSPARPRAGWEVAVKLPFLATPWEHRPMAVSGHHGPATGEPGVTLLGKAQPETQVPVCPHSTDCRSRSPRTRGLSPDQVPRGTLSMCKKVLAPRARIRVKASELG